MTHLAITIADQLTVLGTSTHPDHRHPDVVRRLLARTLERMPSDIRDWVLTKTNHVFVGNSELTSTSFLPLGLQLNSLAREAEGHFQLRFIFLSEQLRHMSEDQAMYQIAHSIAHSYKDHAGGDFADQLEADELVGRWGFQAHHISDLTWRSISLD